MNLQPRIDSISGALGVEYLAAAPGGMSEPFEVLLNKIEIDIAQYREYLRD